MDPELQFTITIIVAVIGSLTNTILLIVLYLTLRQATSQNKMNQVHNKTQIVAARHSLTFAFADWIATEIKYYSPLYKNQNSEEEKVLSSEKINKHLISIARKMVVLCKDNTVDANLMRDEIERMRLTLDVMKVDAVEIESDLKHILDST